MSTSYTKTTTTTKHYLRSQKQAYKHVYVSIHVVNFTPDQYLMHAGSHARARTNTFIHPKCRVNNIHCNDCIETLAYYLTQLIYLSHILSLHPPPLQPIHRLYSHAYTQSPPHSHLMERRKKNDRKRKRQLTHT